MQERILVRSNDVRHSLEYFRSYISVAVSFERKKNKIERYHNDRYGRCNPDTEIDVQWSNITLN